MSDQEPKKAPGRPFTKDDPRINRQGRPSTSAAPPADADGNPVDLLAEMEGVMKRPKAQDRPHQKKFRDWHDGDFPGFVQQVIKLRDVVSREKAKAAKEVPPAAGPCPECAARKAREEAERNIPLEELLKNLMGTASASGHVANVVGEKWQDLSAGARRTVLDALGIPDTFQGSDGRPLSLLTPDGANNSNCY
jgi:hypothetical protein